ncbi:unnamed protein product [Discula destructiva]
MWSNWIAKDSRADLPDENKGPAIVAVSVSLTAAAFLIVCLRVWCRVRLLKSFGADDWVMIGTMVLSLICMGATLGQVANGAGRHANYLSAKTIQMGLKVNYVGQIFFLWAPYFVKLSISLFLLRVTPDVFYRRIIYGTISFLFAWTFACFITLLLQCRNIAVTWDASVQTHCWSLEVIHGLGWASAIMSISSDIFYAVLPIAMLWKLQMNTRRKASLGAILGLGIFASAAAITKSVYIQNYSSNTDNLWNTTELTIWTTVELNVGIIAASLPCLRPIFKILRNGPGAKGVSANCQYPMHPYDKSPNQDPDPRYLKAPTSIHTTIVGGRLRETKFSEERISPHNLN